MHPTQAFSNLLLGAAAEVERLATEVLTKITNGHLEEVMTDVEYKQSLGLGIKLARRPLNLSTPIRRRELRIT